MSDLFLGMDVFSVFVHGDVCDRDPFFPTHWITSLNLSETSEI